MAKRIEVHISTKLSDCEWGQLKLFCEKCERLLATKLIASKGASIKSNINFERTKGFTFDVTQLPPEEQISEFLMAFRFFYLQKEKSHFQKILGIIGKHSDDPDVKKALKIAGKQWQDSLFGKAIQFSINGEQINSSMLLDLWFNAHYFHSDEEKEIKLNALKDFFSEDFTKYMLLDATYEASGVILKFHSGLRQLVSDHYQL